MATKKFRDNLVSLFKILKNPEDLSEFLIKKKAFSEEFVKMIMDSEQLSRYRGVDAQYSNDVSEFRQKINYEVSLDPKSKKISVDITKNDVFSYYDTEEELINKMKMYIRYEDYEKAEILNKYLKTLDISYKY